MIYLNFNQQYEDKLLNLWNKELFFDNINKTIFENKALFDDNFDEELTLLAIEEEKAIGFIMATKRKFPYLERGLEEKKAWINVFIIDHEYLNSEVPDYLYNYIENKLREKGVEQIIYGAYSPNYFFYGLDDEHYKETAKLLVNYVFKKKETHYSMGRDLHGYSITEKIRDKINQLNEKGYKFINFSYDYSLELLTFLKEEFGGGWKRNALIAMQKRCATDRIILVLDKDDKICGFSMRAIDDNPMRFGPIGIAKAKRNEGIGSCLLHYSLSEMVKKGIYHMFFMTTDEDGRRYYQRNGLHVIRTVSNYSKTL